jgi:hypothetical protein
MVQVCSSAVIPLIVGREISEVGTDDGGEKKRRGH